MRCSIRAVLPTPLAPSTTRRYALPKGILYLLTAISSGTTYSVLEGPERNQESINSVAERGVSKIAFRINRKQAVTVRKLTNETGSLVSHSGDVSSHI